MALHVMNSAVAAQRAHTVWAAHQLNKYCSFP